MGEPDNIATERPADAALVVDPQIKRDIAHILGDLMQKINASPLAFADIVRTTALLHDIGSSSKYNSLADWTVPEVAGPAPQGPPVSAPESRPALGKPVIAPL